MTKNEIKAKLALAISLAENCKKLLDEVCDTLAPSAEDDIFDTCNGIQDCEITDIDQVMEEIEDTGCFKELNIPEGEPIEQVSIDIDSLLHIKIPCFTSRQKDRSTVVAVLRSILQCLITARRYR